MPYRDGYFDGVYHFGGINLFGDIKQAILEMNRVCQVGGRVVFGDESISPHLKRTEYGRMLIENNPLWDEDLPLDQLPENACNVAVNYVLGNCFYLIGFDKSSGLPDIDLDVAHKGLRGGSIRKRHFGKLEGVDPDLRNKIYAIAKERQTSVSAILEDLIRGLR